jgi:hypothetical protein
MTANILDFKEGDLIEFNYLYSNLESRIGIIISIEADFNFAYMMTILSSSLLEKIPFSIIECKLKNYEKQQIQRLQKWT